ncbi:MAG: M15 family metallopeptidase [Myxococcales bacterium]|nr:M15 family metallopeptidase [Myxococcales bacterium]
MSARMSQPRPSRRIAAPVLSLLTLSAVALGACSDTADADVEVEDAPVAAQSSPLISAVDCTSRTATAYVSGSPRTIQTIRIDGKAVTRATGHAFLAMQRAAHDAGVYLALNSGFRSNEEQQYLYNCYLTGRCNNGNLAARPGYSNHQSGTAVDVTTSSWLASNAGRFGFRRTVPSEPWHYEYDGPDPGGVCDAVSWVSPKDGGWYTNGVWMKARAAGAAKVVYRADRWTLGESTDASQDFALRYTFNTLGYRDITATAYSASGQSLGSRTITIRVLD